MNELPLEAGGVKGPRTRVAVALLAGRQVLLIHRWKEGAEYYVVPGGGVEPGETIDQAARREIREETSLSLEGELVPLIDIESCDERHGRRQRYVAFTAEAPTIEVASEVGSPESHRESPSNRYTLEWVDLASVTALNVQPPEIKPALRGIRPQELRRAVAEIRLSRPPAGMRTRIVAVDGPGGAGKTTLSEWLAGELGAAIVHTDDFASWENPTNWWPDLVEKVLKPIAASSQARYVPTRWAGPEPGEVVVCPDAFLILEGVTASREAFRPYLTYAIWIETPPEVRLRRGLERDGEEMRGQWERWMAGEDRYIERERPAESADLVLPGDRDLWGKPR
jgi:ADP-ribose pyrophosphatase YjhB (NUDIX family)/uridine kinase